MEIAFLSVDDVIDIHRDQLTHYGGSEGLRDVGLLESAVAMPKSTVGEELLHTDIYLIAAAYLFHLVQNHPFIDGNKRVGTATALVFLDINGVDIEVGDDELVELVLEVAQGRCNKATIATFLRTHAQPQN